MPVVMCASVRAQTYAGYKACQIRYVVNESVKVRPGSNASAV